MYTLNASDIMIQAVLVRSPGDDSCVYFYGVYNVMCPFRIYLGLYIGYRNRKLAYIYMYTVHVLALIP